MQFVDRDGNLRNYRTLYKRLHERDNSLVQDLASLGFYTIPGKEQSLKKYLAAYATEERIESVNQLGWHETTNGLNFILPSGSINCTGDDSIIFQPEKYDAAISTMQTRGTLADWQKEVARLCSGQAYLIFALAAGLASSLLKPANMDSFGIHLVAPSSRGKTTALQVAASMWGGGADPATDGHTSYTRKWNSTANAFEALAAARNDLPLILDELGTCDTYDFGKVIYNLFGGQGKNAMDVHRNLKVQRSWGTLVLSTGEISVKQKMDEGGSTLRAGQQVRFLDVRVSSEIIKSEDAASLANELKQKCALYHGTAGPEFLKRLIKESANWLVLSARITELLNCSAARLTFKGANQEQTRAIRRFALIETAGILAVQLGILPFTQEEVKEAIKIVLNDWLNEVQLISDVERGIESIKNFILQSRDSRFKKIIGMSDNVPVEDHLQPIVREIAGYWNIEKGEFWFTAEGFKEACGGYDYKEVAKGLYQKKILIKDEYDRLNSKHTIPWLNKQIRLYIVRSDILEVDRHEMGNAEANNDNAESVLVGH